MKICWYHSHFGRGGGPVTVLSWARGLRKLGCEIEFMGEGGALAHFLPREKFLLHELRPRRRPSLANAIAFASHARRMKADAMIAVGILTGMEAAVASYFLQKPIVFILNVSPREMMWWNHPSWRFPRVSDMVVVSRAFGELCVRQYGWPAERIHTITARLEMDSYRELPSANGDDGHVLLVRSLEWPKVKAVFHLLGHLEGVLRRSPRLSLTLAGEGEGRRQVERIAEGVNERLGRRAVECRGYAEDITRLLRAHRVVVGSERCALEALAAGRITFVVSNGGEIWRVTPERLELLAEDNFVGAGLKKKGIASARADEIAEASINSCSKDDIERCRRWVHERYDAAAGSRSLFGLLQDLVKSRRGPGRPLEFLGAWLSMCGILGWNFLRRRFARFPQP